LIDYLAMESKSYTFSLKSDETPEAYKVTPDHFSLTTERLHLQDHQALAKPLFVSVDPYLRGMNLLASKWNNKTPVSGTVIQIIDSKHQDFRKGDFYFGYLPWSNPILLNEKRLKALKKLPPTSEGSQDQKEPETFDLSKLPLSHFLSTFGMTGMTAYYGLLVKGQLKPADTVVVSGAAGAVGSTVGQIAKHCFGCYVVGSAGSPEKIKYLKEELGFDEVINYKDYDTVASMRAELKSALAERKVDLYFDNTGGLISESIWDLMADFGRVIVCGQISVYEKEKIPKCEPFMHKILSQRLCVQGILVGDFKDHDRFYHDMAKWYKEGKLKVKETIVDGFEHIPHAMCGLFQGANIGKMIVRCGNEIE